jgi:hypothetical protein
VTERRRGMKLPSTRVIVFNAAAAVIGVAVLIGVIKPLVVSPTSVPCSERYKNSTTFALTRGGMVLTAADLQAGLGGRDSGVIDNLTITPVKNGPAAMAMSVKLPKGSASPLSSTDPKGGMSFPWEPRSIQGKSTVCLAYHVLLPSDFDFARGGRLPGLVGADDAGDASFAARLVWRPGGLGAVSLRTSGASETRQPPVDLGESALPRGRWFRIEQEVVLNAPKQADGKLLVWLDGQLAGERHDLVFRTRSSVGLTGVAADAFYGDEGGGIVPKDATILLSPFELRWE